MKGNEALVNFAEGLSVTVFAKQSRAFGLASNKTSQRITSAQVHSRLIPSHNLCILAPVVVVLVVGEKQCRSYCCGDRHDQGFYQEQLRL